MILPLIRIRSYRKWFGRRIIRVRSHYRKRPRLNFFFAKNGVFTSGGLSKRYGPYLVVGYKKGRIKLKTSVGLKGHKVSASFKIRGKSKITLERNLTFNKTSVEITYKRSKIKF